MFFFVKESELLQLANRTTKNITAYTLDPKKSSMGVTDKLYYQYLPNILPDKSEIATTISDCGSVKKAAKKLSKKYVKYLYNPGDFDTDSDGVVDTSPMMFSMAILTLLSLKEQNRSSMIVFVRPNELSEPAENFYKFAQIFLNNILAEFFAKSYAVDKKNKKKVPVVLYTHFPTAFVVSPKDLKTKGMKKKEAKAYIKHIEKMTTTRRKYFKSVGSVLADTKIANRVLKKKDLRKLVVDIARATTLSKSGKKLYDLLNIAYSVQFNDISIEGRAASGAIKKKKARIGHARIIAERLTGRYVSKAKLLAESCTKSGKKHVKKMLKRAKKIKYTDFYEEFCLLMGNDGGLGSALNLDFDIPKLTKKVIKNKKAYEKFIEKMAKLDLGVFAALSAHIATRAYGHAVGSKDYVAKMNAAFACSRGLPNNAAKVFAEMVKPKRSAAKSVTK